MGQTTTSYATPQGLRLLESVVREIGPLFTRQDISPLAKQQGLTPGHLSRLITALQASGYIVILKRGLYLVQSPLYAEKVHPFAIAVSLVEPAVISHWSAVAHHGFTTQMPAVVQASTPRKVVTPEMRRGKATRPRGRAVWRVLDLEVEYIHVVEKRFFGHQPVWVDNWHRVHITDLERTALDVVARSDVFGGMRAAMEILEEAVPRLNISRLVEYSLRYDVGATIKRMGWALERLGVPEVEIAPLQAYPVTAYYRLDPRGPATGKTNRRWHLKENILEGRHA